MHSPAIKSLADNSKQKNTSQTPAKMAFLLHAHDTQRNMSHSSSVLWEDGDGKKLSRRKSRAGRGFPKPDFFRLTVCGRASLK